MSAPGVTGDTEKDVPLALINFQLPPPRPLSEDERGTVLRSAITRIRNGAQELAPPAEVLGQTAHVGLPASDMWMLLLVRMVTRAPASDEIPEEEEARKEEEDAREAEDRRNDETRRTLCDYVLEDFPSRLVPSTYNLDVLADRFPQSTFSDGVDERGVVQ
jgi:symplekin